MCIEFKSSDIGWLVFSKEEIVKMDILKAEMRSFKKLRKTELFPLQRCIKQAERISNHVCMISIKWHFRAGFAEELVKIGNLTTESYPEENSSTVQLFTL